jgi:hypothetical protein
VAVCYVRKFATENLCMPHVNISQMLGNARLSYANSAISDYKENPDCMKNYDQYWLLSLRELDI